MTRLLFAILVAHLVIAPIQAADPLPVWEIDVSPDPERLHPVRWVGFSPDGKSLVSLVEITGQEKRTECLFAWDTTTRKEKFSLDLGRGLSEWSGTRSNAITDAGTVVVAATEPREIRLADGKENPSGRPA